MTARKMDRVLCHTGWKGNVQPHLEASVITITQAITRHASKTNSTNALNVTTTNHVTMSESLQTSEHLIFVSGRYFVALEQVGREQNS